MCRHCGFGLLLALLYELGDLWRSDEEVVPVGVAVLLVEEGTDVLVATSCFDHQLLQLLILLDGLLGYATSPAVVEVFFVGCYDGFLQTANNVEELENVLKDNEVKYIVSSGESRASVLCRRTRQQRR